MSACKTDVLIWISFLKKKTNNTGLYKIKVIVFSHKRKLKIGYARLIE